MSAFLLQAEAAARAPTAGGWAFLLVSIVFVWGLTGWCFYKVLTVPNPQEEAKPPAGFGP